MAHVIFLGQMSGKSKSGNNYSMVRLGELTDNGESRVSQHFTDGKLNGVDSLLFGDIVKTEWSAGRFMGDAPRLAGISKISDSPYFKTKKGDEA